MPSRWRGNSGRACYRLTRVQWWKYSDHNRKHETQWSQTCNWKKSPWTCWYSNSLVCNLYLKQEKSLDRKSFISFIFIHFNYTGTRSETTSRTPTRRSQSTTLRRKVPCLSMRSRRSLVTSTSSWMTNSSSNSWTSKCPQPHNILYKIYLVFIESTLHIQFPLYNIWDTLF